MKSWTIARRITAGFIVVIAITTGLGLLAAIELREIAAGSRTITADSLPGLNAIVRIEGAATQNRLLVYKHLSSTDAADMQALEEQIAEHSRLISTEFEIYTRIARTPERHALVERIHAARAPYLAKIGEILAFSRDSHNPAETYARARKELDPIGLAYGAALQAAIDFELKTADRVGDDIAGSTSTALHSIVVGVVLAVIAGSVIAFVIIRGVGRILRSVTRSLREGAEQIAAAAGQVSGASQQFAEGSSAQAASLEETSSSLEELASMTKRNAESTARANELARQTRRSAETGSTDMQAMNASMLELQDASGDIAKIVQTIDEIAFQTNILALNAAVEAARAGEAGMGFAVVADEVRNLAQRSATAAKETAAKIERTIAKTGQGVEISGRVTRSLDEIVQEIRQVDTLVGEVATASREQSHGVQQINTAVSQMDRITQSNAGGAEESAAAAEELNAQALSLQDAVRELTRLVEGQTTPHAPSAAPAPARIASTPARSTASKAPASRAVTLRSHAAGSAAAGANDAFFS